MAQGAARLAPPTAPRIRLEVEEPPTMIRLPPRRLPALALAGVLALPSPMAVAQPAPPGPEAQQLVDQLRPRTRGIRLPGNDAAQPPAQDTGPATDDRQLSVQDQAMQGAQATPPPARIIPERPRTTTAPPDVPAVAITIQFATGSAELTPTAIRQLAPLGEALNTETLAPYRFRIEGHTDTVGSAAFNQMLSGRRALAVRELLVRRYGVSPSRLEAVGYGDTQLLVPTPPETPEARNRRVQVLNISG
jgi:OmpA-OmpF porin, OOP family